MTDDQNADVDDLDERIRASVRALADEAPEPPRLAGGPEDRPDLSAKHDIKRRVPLAVAVAAVIVLVAGLAILATRADEPDVVRTGTTTSTAAPTTTAAPPERSLYGTTWNLVSATQDGEPIEIPGPDQPATVTFDDHFDCPGTPGQCSPSSGSAYFYSTGCNSGSGSMTVEGDEITPTGSGVETLVACEIENRPFEGDTEDAAGPTTFEIQGDLLILHNPGGRVQTYEATDDGLLEAEGTVLVEDHEATTNYRVAWQAIDDANYVMSFERASSGRNDSARVEADAGDPQVSVKKASVSSSDLVYGMIPAAATTATYVPSKSDPIDLPLLDMDGGPFQAIATMVPPGDQKWTVIATDANGDEVGRMTTDYTGMTIDPFGPPAGEEVARGTHKIGQYRLAWDLDTDAGGTLTLDRAQATSVLPAESVSAGAVASDVVVADIGHLSIESIIFGLAPDEGVRVTVEGGRPQTATDLELVSLPGTTVKAFHGVVPWTSDTWDVTVYDADENVVGTFHHEGD